MNINDLTIGEAKQLVSLFSSQVAAGKEKIMIGSYVIVRCRDAGVHAGILLDYEGREAVLKNSRRLWYWKPANNQKYLSGCAVAGLDSSSKVGAAIDKTILTETCEIMICRDAAAKSIIEAKVDENQ